MAEQESPRDPAPTDTRSPEPSESLQDSKPSKPPVDPVRRLMLWLISAAVVILIYSLIADRLTPFTRQAHITAFLVRMAPEVSGRVVEVPVSDNQVVEDKALLFRIDPTPYEIAVAKAEARLAAAGQAVGANTAAVQTAEAKVASAIAHRDHVREQAGRAMEMVKRGIFPVARADQANAALKDGEAQLAAALAELERAKQNLGPKGQDNPQIQEAAAALREAQLDLLRTEVTAPSRGVITHLQLTPGQYVTTGQGALTFIDARAIWITAQLRENSLEYVQPDTEAEVVFDALPGRVFSARVQSIGWGVGGVIATDPATGLPTTNSAGLNEALRFPVQLALDTERLPENLRYGSQATVVFYAAGVSIMDAIGVVWIRVISLLSYLY